MGPLRGEGRREERLGRNEAASDMRRVGNQQPKSSEQRSIVGKGARVGGRLQKSGNSWKLCCGECDGDPVGSVGPSEQH